MSYKRYEPPTEEHILKSDIEFFSRVSERYARDHGFGDPKERVRRARERLRELEAERQETGEA